MRDLKICILGAGGVGKRQVGLWPRDRINIPCALTVQWVQGIFVEKYDPTYYDDYRKSFDVDGEQWMITTYDTAGTEQFTAMRDLYVKEANAFILVYSLVAQSTFTEIMDLWETIVRIKDTELFPFVLVANKCDLEDYRVIARDQGEQLARKLGAYQFYETSAKCKINVDETFSDAIRAFVAYDELKKKAPKKKKTPNVIQRYLWNKEAKRLEVERVAAEARESAAVVDRMRPPVAVLSGRVFDDVARLFNRPDDPLADCRIVVGDREISCHRVVLALRSPYFRVLFDTPRHAPESRRGAIKVRLPESQWSYDAVFALLRYIYSPYALTTLSADLQIEVLRLNHEVFGVGTEPAAAPAAPEESRSRGFGRKKQPVVSVTFGSTAAAQLPASLGSSSAVAEALSGYAELTHLADVELVAGTSHAAPVPAHRAILAARCPAFFGPMFTSSFSEASADTVRMDSWSPETLALVLRFIYTDRVQVDDPGQIIDLLVAANMLQLPRLLSLCEKAVAPYLTCDNVLEVYQAAEYHGAKQLLDQCEYTIAANYATLSSSIVYDTILPAATKTRIAAQHEKLEAAKVQAIRNMGRPH